MTLFKLTQRSPNLVTNGKADKRGFGLIDNWRVLEREDERMVAVEIKLSDWLYRAALGLEVLSINPDYFRLRGGIERRIYEIARKHCGKQANWKVSINLLYKKSGVKSPVKQFRHEIKRIAASDITPDYRLRYDAEKDQLIVYSRKGNKAAKAQFDDQMKQLFKPKSKASQTELDL